MIDLDEAQAIEAPAERGVVVDLEPEGPMIEDIEARTAAGDEGIPNTDLPALIRAAVAQEN